MQTVTPGASRPGVTLIADGTRHFGGDWESVDEQAALAGLVREGLTRRVGVSNYSTDQITAFAKATSPNRQHRGPAVPPGGPSLEGVT